MMAIGAGVCFIAALALGYAQENTLPTTLLRAIVAMLVGLFLARWWGLILKRQLSATATERAESIEKSHMEEQQPQSKETGQAEAPETEETP